MNYEFIKDRNGNVTIARKSANYGFRNQNVDQIIHQDPEEMNISRYNAEQLKITASTRSDQICPAELQKYVENG